MTFKYRAYFFHVDSKVRDELFLPYEIYIRPFFGRPSPKVVRKCLYLIVKSSKNILIFPKIRFLCFGNVRQTHNRLLRKFNSLISTLLCYCETEDLKASFCIILSCVQPSISAFETFFSVTFRNARSLCNCVVITSKLSSRLLRFILVNFYHLLASFFTRFCIFVKRHSVIGRHICYRCTNKT